MRQPSSIILLQLWLGITAVLAGIFFCVMGWVAIAPLVFSERMIRPLVGILLLWFLGLLWFLAPSVRAQPSSNRPLEGRKRRLRFQLWIATAAVASIAVALWAAMGDLRAANTPIPLRFVCLLVILTLVNTAWEYTKARRQPDGGCAPTQLRPDLRETQANRLCQPRNDFYGEEHGIH
jgi:hypothetical protein